MKVRVLKAAMYSLFAPDDRVRAQRREVGEEFECPEWYARDLVEHGLAEFLSEKPSEPESAQNLPESGENALEMLSETLSEPEASFSASSPLLDILSIRQVAALASAGYRDAMELAQASDDDLEAVSGIGPATVRKIRAWLAEEQ